MVARARRIQAELDVARRRRRVALRRDLRPRPRSGVIGTTGRWLVPLLLPALAEAHPGIQLVVVDATTTSLLPQVVAGRLDLAVVNLPVDDPDLDAEPLFDEDRVLVVPDGHPLAAPDR